MFLWLWNSEFYKKEFKDENEIYSFKAIEGDVKLWSTEQKN